MEFWRIAEKIAKELASDILPIEKLYPPIKNEKNLIDIKQDKKANIEYNKIIDNYKDNFRRQIERILYEDEYSSAIEKGKELSDSKIKKITGRARRIIRDKLSERFENLKVKAKDAVNLNRFIKETEEKINDKLIDTNTVTKKLHMTNDALLRRVKKDNSIRYFKFTHTRGSSRYYFSRSDVEMLTKEEEYLMPLRKKDEDIRKAKSVVWRLESELRFFGSDEKEDERMAAYLDQVRRDLEDAEYILEELKRQRRLLISEMNERNISNPAKE